MIYAPLFDRTGTGTVRTAIIGTGVYGTSLLAQSQRIRRLRICAVCDRNVESAKRALHQAGVSDSEVFVGDSPSRVLAALESGNVAVVEDASLLMGLPVDVIVESTGNPEAGARHAELSIDHGKHVAMVTKETDVTIGPLLKRLADRAGVVYTSVDGDQHGLLIGLVSWARMLGLEVICGGKAHAVDFVFDEPKKVVTDGTVRIPIPDQEMHVLRELPPDALGEAIARRRNLLANLPHLSEADLCESVIAANSTALSADVPTLHGPIVRIPEIPQVLCPESEGGILGSAGVVETVIHLRRPDEAGLGGGVFLVFICRNRTLQRLLETKGVLFNRKGTCGLIYRPYHLLGAETITSILCAGLLGVETGGVTTEPRLDLVAEPSRNLTRGAVVRSDHGSHASDLKPRVRPAAPVEDSTPLPLYLAAGNRLKADIKSKRLLEAGDVEPPPDSRLWALRREQDRQFGGSSEGC